PRRCDDDDIGLTENLRGRSGSMHGVAEHGERGIGRYWVIDVHLVPGLSEDPCQRNSGALLDDARVRLVRQTEDSDGSAVLELRLDDSRQSVGLSDVHRIRRLREKRLRAEIARERREGFVVARETRTAVRDRSAEVLLADPRVETERVGD